MLDGPGAIREGNFQEIDTRDLRVLFGRYDREFFGGLLAAMLRDRGAGDVVLRLSNRMTSAGGTTTALIPRPGDHPGPAPRPEFEIAVSTLLLFESFRQPGREVSVGGLVCRDRLEALQRIFEHELLHLAEFLATGRSSCAREDFRILSRQDLRARGPHARPDDPPRGRRGRPGHPPGRPRPVRVRRGVPHRRGQPDHPTRDRPREDPAGRAFTDGKRYATFYVPVSMLAKA